MNMQAGNARPDELIHLTFDSERLRFQPLGDEDLPFSVELWTNPEITKYVGGPSTEDVLRRDHSKFMRRCAGGVIGVWTLTTHDTNEKIGTAILLPMPVELDDTDWDLVVGDDLPDAQVEVGYILKKSAWGKGFATEACIKIIDFGFKHSKLEEIVASIDRENTASKNVLMKSGMTDEGEAMSYGEICPYFRITPEAWKKRRING